MRRRRSIKKIIELIEIVIEGLINYGTDVYLFLMIFSLVTVGLARLILKLCNKPKFKYYNLIIFCSIGLIISGIFKVFSINLSKKYLEALICIGMNIIIFVIFKYIKKKQLKEPKEL